MTPNFEEWLQAAAARVNARLAEAAESAAAFPPLAKAVQHALLGGGKRLRPAMLIAVAETPATVAADDAAKAPPQQSPSPALEAACALESLHCYSLIHDDLPCMDAADFRRGKPSCHKAHGEAMALLAGDCLQALAFQLLAQSGLPAAACDFLAQAAGGRGIVGGQAQDIAAEPQTENEFSALYEEKTAALFVCAARLGLLCRGEKETARLDSFAQNFGALFQIANDIAGENEDRAAGKRTAVTVLGKERAKKLARQKQKQAAAQLNGAAFPLAAMLDFAAAETMR